nr:uncharacterized protein LOC114821418 [Malus domestica]
MNQELLRPVSNDEIKAMLFQMHPTKAPGLDGMSPGFYQKHWETVGQDVCDGVLTNRLKVILPEIISPLQSAFIPRRLISYICLVASEIAHYMHRKNNGWNGVMALKLDINKAYRIEWSFLEQIMKMLGFAEEWIHWIMMCVSTVSYSFKLNGEPVDLVYQLYLIRGRHKTEFKGFRYVESPTVHHLLFVDDSFIFASSLQECL